MLRRDQELLRGLDLNLLRALLAALDAGSVTVAAKRIGLTQSAMSRALDRLRHELRDPLFVRSGRGVLPTTRALSLHEPLRRVFALLSERILAPAAFDAATTTRRFTVEARDYADVTLLPELVRSLSRRAPHASLRVVRPELGVSPAEIDLRLHPVGSPLGPNEELLFEETFVLVGRRAHPRLRRRLDVRTFSGLRQLLVAPEGGTAAGADARLAASGLRRDIAVFVPGYTSLGAMLEESDLVAILPARIAAVLQRRHALRVCEVPIAVPTVRAGQSWHPRFARDEGVSFLRALVREVAGA